MSILRKLLRKGLAGIVVFVCLPSFPAWPQAMIDPARPGSAALTRQIDRMFATETEGTLACRAEGLDPRLNFAFRWHSGYRARFPVGQFDEGEQIVRVVFRVSPQSARRASYFWHEFEIPAGVRQKGQSGQVSGGFFLGEGAYVVDWMMIDRAGRTCRKQWRVKLRLNEKQRAQSQFVKPDTAVPIVLRWEGTADELPRPFRIAVIVHLAPVFPRSIRLTAFDQSLLTTMLTSLLEETPFREASVSAISLEKHDVLFRTDRLDPRSFNGLLDAMDHLDLATIGIDQYADLSGPVDLLANLVNGELASPDPPDAIVFIGPNSRHTMKFPPERLESIAGRKPLFFYLKLDYYSSRFPWADSIERLTKGQRGKVYEIQNPRQLQKAIEEMKARLLRARRSGG